jgi:hypothetical protein
MKGSQLDRVDTTVFAEIQANVESLSIDDIKLRLEPLIDGMVVSAPLVPSGTFLYRGRLLNSEFTKAAGVSLADLIYPPLARARAGRVNRPSKPMFYCSVSKESVLFELDDLRAGSELILTNWQTTDQMVLNSIGYTQRVFDALGAKRKCPTWAPEKVDDPAAAGTVSVPEVSREQLYAKFGSDLNDDLRHILSELFATRVTTAELAQYKITAAIAELHLGRLADPLEKKPKISQTEFSGLLYPSIGMWANADNLALIPWFVDKHVKFLKAAHLRIDSYAADADGRASMHWTGIDCATEFGDDGCLRWLGRNQNWTIKPLQKVKFKCVRGPYSDGDYEYNADGNQSHWDATDTASGEPVYRA